MLLNHPLLLNNLRFYLKAYRIENLFLAIELIMCFLCHGPVNWITINWSLYSFSYLQATYLHDNQIDWKLTQILVKVERRLVLDHFLQMLFVTFHKKKITFQNIWLDEFKYKMYLKFDVEYRTSHFLSFLFCYSRT